jgi:hypothetical protein
MCSNNTTVIESNRTDGTLGRWDTVGKKGAVRHRAEKNWNVETRDQSLNKRSA